MALYPKPHTEEWFTALEKQNPRQAAMTRQIIGLAGREDVCSICGDDPSKEYKLTSPAPMEEDVATIRLCDDCLNIQKGNGQTFAPNS